MTAIKKFLLIFSAIMLVCGGVYAQTQPLISGGNAYGIIDADGELIAWGRNDFGQCNIPENVNFKSFSAGYSHAVGLDETGKLYAWGEITSFPDGEYKLAAAGKNFSAAVTTDNVLVMSDTAENRHTLSSAAVALTAGDGFAAVLDETGTIGVFGDNTYGVKTADGVTDVCAVAAGERHILVLKTDGTVAAFGDNTYGQCDVPQDKARAIAAGGFHNVVLKTDGSVAAFGDNAYGQCDVPQEKATAVGAGYEHTSIVTLNGELVTVGNNRYGVCIGKVGTLNQISNGLDSTCFLDDEGNMYFAGSNAAGKNEPPEFSGKVVKTAVGGNHTMALCDDGTVKVWGSNIYNQCDVPTYLTNVTDIAAGYNSCLAVQDGKVYGWGYNIYGQCSPPDIDETVVSVAAGQHHGVALTENGNVYAWGNDYTNQTVVPENMGTVTKIAAGDYYTLALNSDGDVFGWGYDADGQFEFAKTTDVKNIYAGAFVSAIEYNDGTTVFGGVSDLIPETVGTYRLLSLGHGNITAEDTAGNIISYGAEEYIIPQSLCNLTLIVNLAYGEPPVVNADAQTVIQFENYDTGGANVSYYDTTEGNGYGYYRNDDVEIPTTGKSDSLYCVSVAETEWLNFTVEAAEDVQCALWINSAANSDATVGVYVNDECITDKTYLPKTGGSTVFKDGYICDIRLTKGSNVIKIKNTKGSFAADYFTLKPPSDEPYTHLTAPGTIIPYQYNTGGLDVSYASPVRVKNGLGSNAVRPTDYIHMTYIGNNVVSSFQPGDWLEYTLDVTLPGKYGVYITSQGNGNANQKGKVSIYADGTLAADNVDLGATTSLTEKYAGNITLENTTVKLRVANSCGYGWLLGNIRLVCEEETDKNSVSLSENNGTYTAEAYYTNKSDTDETLYLIIAGYNGAKLEYVSVKEITAEANTFEKYTASLDMNGVATAKAFLWDTLPGGKVLLQIK